MKQVTIKDLSPASWDDISCLKDLEDLYFTSSSNIYKLSYTIENEQEYIGYIPVKTPSNEYKYWKNDLNQFKLTSLRQGYKLFHLQPKTVISKIKELEEKQKFKFKENYVQNQA